MPLSDLIQPKEWVAAGKDLATWLQQDIGVKAGYVIIGILVFYAILKLIQAVKE